MIISLKILRIIIGFLTWLWNLSGIFACNNQYVKVINDVKNVFVAGKVIHLWC